MVTSGNHWTKVHCYRAGLDAPLDVGTSAKQVAAARALEASVDRLNARVVKLMRLKGMIN